MAGVLDVEVLNLEMVSQVCTEGKYCYTMMLKNTIGPNWSMIFKRDLCSTHRLVGIVQNRLAESANQPKFG